MVRSLNKSVISLRTNSGRPIYLEVDFTFETGLYPTAWRHAKYCQRFMYLNQSGHQQVKATFHSVSYTTSLRSSTMRFCLLEETSEKNCSWTSLLWDLIRYCQQQVQQSVLQCHMSVCQQSCVLLGNMEASCLGCSQPLPCVSLP